MFGLRSNQSDKSMMFGSNKLERGIIFVTVLRLFVVSLIYTMNKYLVRVVMLTQIGIQPIVDIG